VSIKVKEWLERLGIETTHEERFEIDREIEFITGRLCDEGISQLTKEQFIEVVNKVKKRKRSQRDSQILAEALA